MEIFYFYLVSTLVSMLVVTVCNHLERTKFWTKDFQFELFVCFIPLINLVTAIIRLICVFMVYVDGNLKD